MAVQYVNTSVEIQRQDSEDEGYQIPYTQDHEYMEVQDVQKNPSRAANEQVNEYASLKSPVNSKTKDKSTDKAKHKCLLKGRSMTTVAVIALIAVIAMSYMLHIQHKNTNDLRHDVLVMKTDFLKAVFQLRDTIDVLQNPNYNKLYSTSYYRGRDGKYYKLYTVPKTWNGAKKQCEKDFAHLAIIDNKLTHDFILQVYPKGMWIGATDNAVENTWKWVNGIKVSKPEYWRNRSNEPNGGTKENCLEMNRGDHSWNDLSCERTRQHLCQKEVIFSTIYDLKYNRYFLGYGDCKDKSSEINIGKTRSLFRCLDACAREKDSDHNVDDALYEVANGTCLCNKMSEGHIPNDKYIHYKLE